MLLTLCPTCAAQFYNSEQYIIRRVSRRQDEKDVCTFCSRGRGYDYLLINKKGRGRNANVR